MTNFYHIFRIRMISKRFTLQAVLHRRAETLQVFLQIIPLKIGDLF